MSLRFRHLQVRIVTSEGVYGTNLQFRDGLTLLRADNSMGKSTCLQAMIYALGLEGMWGPSHEVPLPHAVTTRIDVGDEEIPVLSSEILLEIENHEQRILTIRRAAAGDVHRHLVTVWYGPALTSSRESYDSRDFFIREGGAAVNPSGFHRFLAEFIGWSLPSVPRFDGNEGLLYMECVFPLMYVEQKKGWSSIEGRFPTHFGIREVGARAVEFLLAMEASELALRRALLREQMQALRLTWTNAVNEVESVGKQVSAVLRGIPRSPVAEWPLAVSPSAWLPRKDDWVSLEQAIDEAERRVEELNRAALPTVATDSPEMENRLREALELLREEERAARGLVAQYEAEASQLRSTQQGLSTIDVDLRRNKDARTLQRLGSIAQMQTTLGECPTCSQPVNATLLDQLAGPSPMSVEENISYLEDQRRAFAFMHEQALTAVGALRVQREASYARLSELRSTIRSLRSALVADNRLPSTTVLEEKVRLEVFVDRSKEAKRRIGELLNRFAEFAERWRELLTENAALPSGGLSMSDEEKLAQWEQLVVDQLQSYGMESLPPTSIALSRTNYRPEHEGVDLQFDLSASDTIRLAWAYRLGLLGVARIASTNHPGFLLMDEPKQQEAAIGSFAAMVRRAAHAGDVGQQVIMAVSAPMEVVTSMIHLVRAHVIDVEGRLFQRL